MTRRNAFSLTEVLVVVSIGSTVMALAVSTVHRAMQVSDMAQCYGQQSLHVNRFLDQFRSDVHLGVDIEFHSDQSLTIELADHSEIVYRVDASSIFRDQRSPEGAPIREAIPLAKNTHGSFAFDEPSQTASLQLSRNLDLHSSPPRLERIVEAIRARDRTSYAIEEAKP
jgi:prepilin-type N-terminal cleavage/methylation domain-containing protein